MNVGDIVIIDKYDTYMVIGIIEKINIMSEKPYKCHIQYFYKINNRIVENKYYNDCFEENELRLL